MSCPTPRDNLPHAMDAGRPAKLMLSYYLHITFHRYTIPRLSVIKKFRYYSMQYGAHPNTVSCILKEPLEPRLFQGSKDFVLPAILLVSAPSVWVIYCSLPNPDRYTFLSIHPIVTRVECTCNTNPGTQCLHALVTHVARQVTNNHSEGLSSPISTPSTIPDPGITSDDRHVINFACASSTS